MIKFSFKKKYVLTPPTVQQTWLNNFSHWVLLQVEGRIFLLHIYRYIANPGCSSSAHEPILNWVVHLDWSPTEAGETHLLWYFSLSWCEKRSIHIWIAGSCAKENVTNSAKFRNRFANFSFRASNPRYPERPISRLVSPSQQAYLAYSPNNFRLFTYR